MFTDHQRSAAKAGAQGLVALFFDAILAHARVQGCPVSGDVEIIDDSAQVGVGQISAARDGVWIGYLRDP